MQQPSFCKPGSKLIKGPTFEVISGRWQTSFLSGVSKSVLVVHVHLSYHFDSSLASQEIREFFAPLTTILTVAASAVTSGQANQAVLDNPDQQQKWQPGHDLDWLLWRRKYHVICRNLHNGEKHGETICPSLQVTFKLLSSDMTTLQSFNRFGWGFFHEQGSPTIPMFGANAQQIHFFTLRTEVNSGTPKFKDIQISLRTWFRDLPNMIPGRPWGCSSLFRLPAVAVILYQLRFIFSCIFRKHAREIYHLIHEACPPLCVSFGTTYPLEDAAILDMTFGVEGLSRLKDTQSSLWMTIQHSHSWTKQK